MKSSFALLVVASVGADECEIDTMSALQGSAARVEVKKHHQEVCRSVEVGQKAPIDGVFTANDGSKVTYRATRGDVAQSAGRFCVDEPTVALLQRAFSVSDVSDFDVLVQKKQTTTEEGSTEATASTEATVSGKSGKTEGSTEKYSLLTPNPDVLRWDEPLTEEDAKAMPEDMQGHYDYLKSIVPGMKRLKTGWLKVPVPIAGDFEEEVPFACLRITAIPALTQPAKQGAMLMHSGGPGNDATCPIVYSAALGSVNDDFDLIGISQRGVDQFLNGAPGIALGVGTIVNFKASECPFGGAKPWPQVGECRGIEKLIKESGVEEVLQRLAGKPDMVEWTETISKVWGGKPGRNFGAPFMNETYIRWAYRLSLLEANLCYNSDQFQMTSKVGRSFNTLDHVSTSDLAYDIDLLRRAVGARKMSIYAVSYGTYVGGTYATLFPKKVNKLILDGNMAPMADARAFAQSLSDGPLATWDGLASACENSAAQHAAKEHRCPAGPGVDTKLKQLMFDPSVNQTKAIAVANAFLNTVFDDGVPCAAALMRCIADMDEGVNDLSSCFFAAGGGVCHAQDVTELDWSAPYSGYALLAGAIYGLDNSGRMLEEEYIAWWRTQVAESPLGLPVSIGESLLVAVWPGLPRPPPPFGDATLTPLIVGTLHDVRSTAYKNSQRMSVAFPSGKQLTWQGYGHTLTGSVLKQVPVAGLDVCYKHVLQYLKFDEMPQDYVCKTGAPAMAGPGPIAD